MIHRTFIAINLPEKIKQKLSSFQKDIDEKFDWLGQEISVNKIINWTKKDNLHITLAFLGNITDNEILDISKSVKNISFKNKQFFINLNKICYGPIGKIPPRMVWVKGEESKSLSFLKNCLEKKLFNAKTLKNYSTNNLFSPHITLGRIMAWNWKRIDIEERPEIEEDISLKFEINSIEVMESQLSRGGPKYTILESVPLLDSEN
ncbi:MAG: RNA 2',3'-cyclic phosphodiesterase [Patescibacteria group bacterium]|nr:RNA 2',3'-cyclic phosphodiesterase [Patescibacteria group bacterium]